MQEGLLWKKERNGIRCMMCARKCFITKDKSGYCLVKKNIDNKLFTLNYGKIINASVEPIEKMPLFHYYPSSNTFSIVSVGDNFSIQDSSKLFADKKQEETIGEEYTPEKIVSVAEGKNCLSISYSGIEPFLYLEFAYRVAKAAHRSNTKNIFVTNGFATDDAIKKIGKYLDAVTVNFQGSVDPQFYSKFFEVKDTAPLFVALKQMKKQRLHIEITNTIIPQIGDNLQLCKNLAEWINAEIGSEVPFHIVQFQPNDKIRELPPTPVAVLEKCITEAKKAGLRYVYIGNVPKHAQQNTYCYNCMEPLIIREGYKVKKISLSEDRCPNCGLKSNVSIV